MVIICLYRLSIFKIRILITRVIPQFMILVFCILHRNFTFFESLDSKFGIAYFGLFSLLLWNNLMIFLPWGSSFSPTSIHLPQEKEYCYLEKDRTALIPVWCNVLNTEVLVHSNFPLIAEDLLNYKSFLLASKVLECLFSLFLNAAISFSRMIISETILSFIQNWHILLVYFAHPVRWLSNSVIAFNKLIQTDIIQQSGL